MVSVTTICGQTHMCNHNYLLYHDQLPPVGVLASTYPCRTFAFQRYPGLIGWQCAERTSWERSQQHGAWGVGRGWLIYESWICRTYTYQWYVYVFPPGLFHPIPKSFVIHLFKQRSQLWTIKYIHILLILATTNHVVDTWFKQKHTYMLKQPQKARKRMWGCQSWE